LHFDLQDIVNSLNLSEKEQERLEGFIEMDKLDWFKEVVSLGTGESFGELALINEAPRAATITCHKECYFAVIGRAEYQRVLKKIQWKDVQKKIEFFLQIPFFNHWTRTQINKLIYLFSEQNFLLNQTVYNQGDKVDMVYIVKEGFFESLKVKKFINSAISEFETQNQKLFIGPKETEAKTKKSSTMVYM
jgi:CRP-like cAMP-binding protein